MEVLPIINTPEKAIHQDLVNLVEAMLQLHLQKQPTVLPYQLQLIEQRIPYTDTAVNKKA